MVLNRQLQDHSYTVRSIGTMTAAARIYTVSILPFMTSNVRVYKKGPERLAGLVEDLGIVDTDDQRPPSNQGRVPGAIRRHAIRFYFWALLCFSCGGQRLQVELASRNTKENFEIYILLLCSDEIMVDNHCTAS
jgi:hypothetical protein